MKRHFGGYGYKAEDVSAQQIGFDLEVSNAKGVTLLKVAVKGTASGLPGFKLTGEERTASARDPSGACWWSRTPAARRRRTRSTSRPR